MSHDSEIAITGRFMKARKRIARLRYGVECPTCKVKLPKAQPTILLPQQVCKVCRYRDPRAWLTPEQTESIDSAAMESAV